MESTGTLPLACPLTSKPRVSTKTLSNGHNLATLLGELLPTFTLWASFNTHSQDILPAA